MKVFVCPVDKRKFTNLDALVLYVEKNYPEAVPAGVTTKQWLFNIRNGLPPANKYGKSILSGKPTEWNEKAGRYERLRDDKEKEEFRKLFKERMQKKYGKDTLLDDPEVQQKMLENRKISGKYEFQDGSLMVYTGTYEKDFLEVMDVVIDWPSRDIFMPCPFVVDYISPRDEKKHFYMPDVYIDSLKLIVEIKSEDNKHYRKRDEDIEKAKDAAIAKTGIAFIKIYDKDYRDFIEMIKFKKDEKF